MICEIAHKNIEHIFDMFLSLIIVVDQLFYQFVLTDRLKLNIIISFFMSYTILDYLIRHHYSCR